MIIIPFIHKVTCEKDMNIHNIRILTIGGKKVWEEYGNIEEILNLNKIYGNIEIIDDIYLCEVNIEKTDIHDIYKWSEIDINDTETFCWRDYVYFIGKNKEFWLSPQHEKVGDLRIDKLLELIKVI